MTSCLLGPNTNLKKRLLFTFFAMLSFLGSYAQKTSTGSGDWSNAATWTPAGVPAATDNVTIAAGHNVRVDAGANCANMTITGTLRLDDNSLTVNGNWTNNGTFTCQQQNNTNETIIFRGTAATIGGTSTTAFSGLNINTTGTVTVLSNSIRLGTGQYNEGRLTLQAGTFDIGAGHSMDIMSQQNSVNIVSNGGNFRSYGPTGWTLNVGTAYDNDVIVTGRVDFDNISPLSPGFGNFGYQIVSNTAASATAGLHINGLVTVKGAQSQNWRIEGNAPVWGPASTLYIDRQNQPYIIANNNDKSWLAMASGTIGVTPGYPNNITLVNMGNGAGDGAGWAPTGDVAINGTLRIGDGTTTGIASLRDVTNFSSGGIVVENNSTLKGPLTSVTSFINKGDFLLQGATTGIFLDNGGAINFAGSGTIGTPQVINTTGVSVPFTNMTVSNGTYVKLQKPVSVSGTLNLAAGYIGTTTTNVLTINNTSTAAITGGSATAYVDGPLAWAIPATTTGSYRFPIGDRTRNGGAYLPLTLAPNSTNGTIATATAFNTNSNGTPGASVTSLSTTEYWSLTTSTPFSSGPLVSVSRPSSVAPNNALASSGSSNGVYEAIGGTPSGTSMNNGGVGTASPAFIAIVTAPLSVVKLTGKNATCTSSTGSLTVGGSGGTAPYTYSVDGGAFQSSGYFSPLAGGNHNVTVRDANGTTATATLKVLGSLIINGNDKDVVTCPPASTTLTATNEANSSPTFSWSPGGQTTASITVSPTVTTTYTVTSTLYSDNLITNGSFESGNTGFTSSYSYYTGAAYTTTPGNNGYYSVSNAGINQCQYFSTTGVANAPSLAAQDGALYFIGDGATFSSMVWSQTINGLTIGTVYRFQFYYAAGDPDNAARAVLRPTINGGGSLGDVTCNNSTGWTLATYNWTANSATAVLTITNMTTSGNTNANDFFMDNMQFLAPCLVSTSIKVIPDCSLPVELTDFNAVKQGNGALLNWGTSMEVNSSYFVVEKSSDGIHFSAIGEVKAAGNSSIALRYSFVDPAIASGITYYRLAQYDLDGTVHYSVIRTVTKDGTTGVQVTPNPNNGNFVITFDQAGEVKAQISVVNSLGQTVYTGETIDTNFKNIDITALASGIYYLQVNTGAETIVKKIVKE